VKTKVKNVDKDFLQVDTSYPGLIPQVKTAGSTKWVDIAVFGMQIKAYLNNNQI
jgi:hypothetical protein